MSFYVYHGKINDDLFVAVLPKGTVEEDDPVYIYSEKQFSSYRAKDVSVKDDDGEDHFKFYNAFDSFEADSKKGYRELSIIRKCRNGETAKAVLVRHYSQPHTANSLPDPPKVWTGKNDSFIIIAPQGLGTHKPIVSVWQWAEGDRNAAKTISCSTGKQESNKANPGEFSFKQGDNHTLKCQVDSAQNCLQATISTLTKPAKVQTKHLILSAKVELGAEHAFSPPQKIHKEISFECSLPTSKPSLTRITGPLPFPADLVETLTYSAAYVDQAGYLAKYAVKQFDKLEKSFQQLDKKSEARGAKVIKLEGENTKLNEDKRSLEVNFAALQKTLEKEREDAKRREKDLSKQLADTRKSLQNRVSEVSYLRSLIKDDEFHDREREAEWKRRMEAEESALECANSDLKAALAREKELQQKSADQAKTIETLKADRSHFEKQLVEVTATNTQLQADLLKEQGKNTGLTALLDQIKSKLVDSEIKRESLESEIGKLNGQIQDLEERIATKVQQYVEAREEVDAANHTIRSMVNFMKQTEDRTNLEKTDLEKQVANLKKKIADLGKEAPTKTNPIDLTKGGVLATVAEIRV